MKSASEGAWAARPDAVTPLPGPASYQAGPSSPGGAVGPGETGQMDRTAGHRGLGTAPLPTVTHTPLAKAGTGPLVYTPLSSMSWPPGKDSPEPSVLGGVVPDQAPPGHTGASRHATNGLCWKTRPRVTSDRGHPLSRGSEGDRHAARGGEPLPHSSGPRVWNSHTSFLGALQAVPPGRSPQPWARRRRRPGRCRRERAAGQQGHALWFLPSEQSKRNFRSCSCK